MSQEPENKPILNVSPTPDMDSKSKSKKKKKKVNPESNPPANAKKKVVINPALNKLRADIAKRKKMEEEIAKQAEEKAKIEAELEKIREEDAKKKAEENKIRKAELAKQKKERQASSQKEQAEAKRLEIMKQYGMDTSILSTPKPSYRVTKRNPKKNKKENETVKENKVEMQKSLFREGEMSPVRESWEDWLSGSDEEKECLSPSLEKTITPNNKPEAEKIVKISKIAKIEKPKKEILKGPICCILGNVDSGKTTFVDKIKSTNVAGGEAGGITQDISSIWINAHGNKYDIPGIMILDTPGHDSFHNLRHLGASVCDWVLLMIDITEEIKEQTIKAIKLIKEKRIPFIVILNKLDRIYQWESNPKIKFEKSLNSQAPATQNHFYQRISAIETSFSEQGLNVRLFCHNDDPKKMASMLPVSSKSGEGIGEILGLVLKLSDQFMRQKLILNPDNRKGVIIQSQEIKGFGKSVEIILVDGIVKVGDPILLESVNGCLPRTIQKIIMPELTAKKKIVYNMAQSKSATSSFKIIIKDIDIYNLIIGSNILFTHEKYVIDQIQERLESQMNCLSDKTTNYGITIHSRSFGALEAIMDFLDDKDRCFKTKKEINPDSIIPPLKKKIPYFNAKIGRIKKSDYMACDAINQKALPDQKFYNILVAFDTEFNFNPKDFPDVKTTIITGNVIYEVFDKIQNHISQQYREFIIKENQQIVNPAKVSIISKEHIFATRNPIIVGVRVDVGELKLGTPLIVFPGDEFDEESMSIGSVEGIRTTKGQNIESAKVGEEVSIRIEPIAGETTRMLGRDFKDDLPMYSKIDYEMAQRIKKYSWDIMSKEDRDLVYDLCF